MCFISGILQQQKKTIRSVFFLYFWLFSVCILYYIYYYRQLFVYVVNNELPTTTNHWSLMCAHLYFWSKYIERSFAVLLVCELWVIKLLFFLVSMVSTLMLFGSMVVFLYSLFCCFGVLSVFVVFIKLLTIRGYIVFMCCSHLICVLVFLHTPKRKNKLFWMFIVKLRNELFSNCKHLFPDQYIKYAT